MTRVGSQRHSKKRKKEREKKFVKVASSQLQECQEQSTVEEFYEVEKLHRL